jgi:hypothetical protein
MNQNYSGIQIFSTFSKYNVGTGVYLIFPTQTHCAAFTSMLVD